MEGTGDPVVFIHAGIANLRMWDDQAAGLSDRYRVIRYDTRGYGRTETEAVEFSNRADIAALLDRLGEASAHVVGLSRGGVIALDFAIERPDRVRSLVFAAGGISGYESPAAASPETLRSWNAWRSGRNGRRSPTGRLAIGSTAPPSPRTGSIRPCAPRSTTGS